MVIVCFPRYQTQRLASLGFLFILPQIHPVVILAPKYDLEMH